MDPAPTALSDDLCYISRVLRPCLGPVCSQYLLVTRTLNKVVVTGSGLSVLRHTLKAHADTASRPFVRLVMGSIDAHAQAFGDGTTSLMLMIAEGFEEAKRRTGGSAQEMLALSRGLSLVRSWWLDQVIVPHLRSQCLGVGNSSASRSTPPLSDPEGLGGQQSAAACDRTFGKGPEACPACDSYQRSTSVNSKNLAGESQQPLPATIVGSARHPGEDRTANPRSHETEKANECRHAPTCGERRKGDHTAKGLRWHDRRDSDVDLEKYIERMRAILGTAVGGLFCDQARHLLVEIVVNWIASIAEQIRRSQSSTKVSGGGGVGGIGTDNGDWDQSRRCLVRSTRFICHHQGTLLLKAKGAGLSESRIVDDGVILPYGLIGAYPKRLEASELTEKGLLKFVVLKCPVEPSSLSAGDRYHSRVTVGVSNAGQHQELLRNRGRTIQAVVDALSAAGIGLLVCTHGLKDPFPDLLREAGVAGLQLVAPQDADYLAQRFGARPFHRVTGNSAFPDGADGAVGVARGVRRLCLGQGLQSSFCYVYGDGYRPCDGGVQMGAVEEKSATPCQEGEVEAPQPGLACQVVLRAPSDGLLIEYASCVSRCLALTLKWLEWEPPSGCVRAISVAGSLENQPRSDLCLVVAGGGAFELSLHLLFQKLAACCRVLEDNKRCCRSGGGSGDGVGIAWQRSGVARGCSLASQPTEDVELTSELSTPRVDAGGIAGSAVQGAFARSGHGGGKISVAFDVLAAAMAVVPRVLLENASTAFCPGKPKQTHETAQPSSVFQLLHTLKSLHAEGLHSAGLVVRTETTKIAGRGMWSIADGRFHPRCTPNKAEPMVSVSCNVLASVVHPLAVKYGMLVAFFDTMIASLRVGMVVRCRGRFATSSRSGVTGNGGGESSEEEEEEEE